MIVRPAASGDVASLTSLLRRSWLATFAIHLPFEAVQVFTQEDPARRYAEAMWAEFAVAEVDGAVAGMCHVVDDLVAAIHIDPGLKRRGVGTELMDRAEARILARYDHARLTVLAFNVGAQAFYRHRGWRVTKPVLVTECGTQVEGLDMIKEPL